MKLSNLFLFPVATFLALSGCDVSLDGASMLRTPISEVQTHSLDGVKWISPHISDGSAAADSAQSTYTISPEGRLLLRFESLSGRVDEITVDKDKRVFVDISLPFGEDSVSAEKSLQLCPITKNWMMLATWYRAFPMPRGSWGQDGGDYDATGCLEGIVTPRSDTTAKSSETALIRFDASRWFVDYVKGRSTNFGLILLSANGASSKVVGDADGTYSPRINWVRVR